MATGVNKWIGDLEQSGTNATRLLEALKSGDTAGLRAAAAQGTALHKQSDAQATALGLPSCAVSAAPSS